MTRPQWIQQLERDVIERDDSTCVNCGRPAADVHHIIPRRGKKWSKKVWRIENMMCICDVCHRFGQTVWMRVQLIRKMQEVYEYDMDWAKDEVVMEEASETTRAD